MQRYSYGYYNKGLKVPAKVIVALLPGGEILGGKLVSEDGVPIAGTRVVLWGYLGEKKDPHEMAYMVDTFTNAKGEWRCGSCRKMKFAYLYFAHPDYVADQQTHPRAFGQPKSEEPWVPNDPALKPLRDFSDVQVMTRGIALAGKVVDKQGRPIANAEVGRLEPTRLETFYWDMPKTTTDAAGRFEFPHVKPGKYLLQVKVRGHAPELKVVTAAKTPEEVSIELAPPHLLSGRFVDTQGKPIADAYVYINHWRGVSSLGVNLKTDADGRFRWEDCAGRCCPAFRWP